MRSPKSLASAARDFFGPAAAASRTFSENEGPTSSSESDSKGASCESAARSGAAPPSSEAESSFLRRGAASGTAAGAATIRAGSAPSSSSSSPKERSLRSPTALRLGLGLSNGFATESLGTMSSKGFTKTSMFRMTISSTGRSFASTCASPIRRRLKTVCPATVPKIVCLPSSHLHSSNEKKNCARFVSGAFSLAMASCPRWLNRIRGEGSSRNGLPQMDSPPSPVPVGSPPWAMKPGMIRWKVVRS
mmetsp:Transcript_26585/g.89451  ORF Transcript_26585/g.89451 Transcript_26585/m.89451 type:complete len:247 (+) Transcript_26585:1011-1751(+)